MRSMQKFIGEDLEELIEIEKKKIKGIEILPGIIEYDFEDYYDLYKNFNPFDKELHYEDFIFRGHSKEKYLLKPTIKRNKEEIEKGTFTKEFELLKSFAKSLSSCGLHLPRGGEYFLRPNSFISNLKEWPPTEILDFLAYAQHNGISTRMLDWTYDINIALYMAADGVVKNVKQMILSNEKEEKIIEENFTGKKIVVWCFNYKQWNKWTDDISQNKDNYNSNDCVLRFTHINYEDNMFAHRQKGLLSYNRLHERPSTYTIEEILQSWNRMSCCGDDNIEIEDYVAKIIESKKKNNIITDTQMIKIAIPAKESLNILDILSKLNYKEETIFPTPQNIAKLIMKPDECTKLKSIFDSAS